MAYEPKTWACGDTITADDLNHIEQGIADSGGGNEPLIVNLTFDTDHYVADVSRSDINTALDDGRIVIGRVVVPEASLCESGLIGKEQGKYMFTTLNDTVDSSGAEYYTVLGLISDEYEWRGKTLNK